jgi:hypothetical protein
MGHILEIEYEYVRVYLNLLSLHALFERCVSNSPIQRNAFPHPGTSAPNGSTHANRPDGVIPPDTLRQWSEDDRKYVSAVSDGCRNVLKVVVDGLLPNDYLKHSPVRTYFRIIAVGVILIKVCFPVPWNNQC